MATGPFAIESGLRPFTTITHSKQKVMMFSRQKQGQRDRRGIEAVEAAITLPLLTIVMFSTIQITHRWHVEKLLKLATFEAIKAGASENGNSEEAIRVFDEHAIALGINDATLEIDASVFDDAETGDYLWLRGNAVTSSNQVPAPLQMILNETMSGGWVCHRKEGL